MLRPQHPPCPRTVLTLGLECQPLGGCPHPAFAPSVQPQCMTRERRFSKRKGLAIASATTA